MSDCCLVSNFVSDRARIRDVPLLLYHVDRSTDGAAVPETGSAIVLPESSHVSLTPAHHEGGIVSDLDVRLNIVNCSVDDEANQSEAETCHDERESELHKVGSESQEQQHHGTSDVWRNSVQVGLDGRVSEPCRRMSAWAF